MLHERKGLTPEQCARVFWNAAIRGWNDYYQLTYEGLAYREAEVWH